MKKFSARLGRFFWSWGFLKFILWTATIIVLFYAEENWRGARAWAATKAKWEAKGESFDFNRLIPPPIPDDQNLAAIPLFKLESDPEHQGNLEPTILRKTIKDAFPGTYPPMNGHWEYGELSDIKKIQKAIDAAFRAQFKIAPPTVSPLVQLETIYPFIAEFRNMSDTRAYYVLPNEYRLERPYALYTGLLTSQVDVVYSLALHAAIALHTNNSDLALKDIQTNFKIVEGLTRQPLLFDGLIAEETSEINFSSLWQGLTLHAWNDSQLANLQSSLAKIDFLADYQLILRGDVFGITIPYSEELKKNRFKLGKVQPLDPKTLFLWPNGWLDINMSQVVAANLQMVHFIDLNSRIVSVASVESFIGELKRRTNQWDARAPWNIFFLTGMSWRYEKTLNFSYAQVLVDEGRIACGLERYRVAHGVYPASLNLLMPACIDALPHDIINGQSYHYQLRADGTYLLYSVGWNQKDDGGQIAYESDNKSKRNPKEGDWVWPELK